MSAPLRVATLSFWHVHAGDYTKSTVKHPNTELVAIWDDDAERGREAAAQYNTEFVADLDELLARDDLDAVTVTTETSRHRDVMLAAARAGKHIFTEKLLAPTVADAQEIIKASDDHGVKLIVSLPRLYHGYTAVISDELASGNLGELSYGRIRLSHNGSVANWLPERFYEPDAAIGGALTDLGCHPVYLAQLFLGASPSTVSATYRSVTDRKVEDNAVVTVGYPSGAIGVIEAGFVSPDPFLIEIGGTQGWLSYSDRDAVVRVSGAAYGDGVQEIPVPPHAPTAYEQWVQHIADDTRADANLAAAVELTRLVVASNEAAASGRTVSYQ